MASKQSEMFDADKLKKRPRDGEMSVTELAREQSTYNKAFQACRDEFLELAQQWPAPAESFIMLFAEVMASNPEAKKHIEALSPELMMMARKAYRALSQKDMLYEALHKQELTGTSVCTTTNGRKGCYKKILWGMTMKGKRVPVDPMKKFYVRRANGLLDLIDGYEPHHVTCEFALHNQRAKKK